ncbi:MAG: hypothetical protein EOP09_17105 [Proteobacteria bacterium]|nr:MAG: hypothetical protein EOP09_17105 [Pseudomonadota bacterium]
MKASALYQTMLRDELAARIAKNARYSLRAFARDLKIEPGVLSQILSGKRFCSESIALQIADRLLWSPDQSDEFLHALARAKKRAGLKRISPNLRARLKKPTSETKQSKDLSLDVFKVIADWQHYAILDLPFTRGYQSDVKWIAAQLGLSVHEARSSVDRLIAVGLMEWQGKVKLLNLI